MALSTGSAWGPLALGAVGVVALITGVRINLAEWHVLDEPIQVAQPGVTTVEFITPRTDRYDLEFSVGSGPDTECLVGIVKWNADLSHCEGPAPELLLSWELRDQNKVVFVDSTGSGYRGAGSSPGRRHVRRANRWPTGR